MSTFDHQSPDQSAAANQIAAEFAAANKQAAETGKPQQTISVNLTTKRGSPMSAAEALTIVTRAMQLYTSVYYATQSPLDRDPLAYTWYLNVEDK